MPERLLAVVDPVIKRNTYACLLIDEELAVRIIIQGGHFKTTGKCGVCGA